MRSRNRLPSQPSEAGVHEGRPYLLWLPSTDPPWPGMLILHGAGSRKENHADFARASAARGWASLAYDQRGHGEADDEMGAGALADVALMARFLAEREGVDASRLCVRGSSMGGLLAIHAGATSAQIGAVIAICPASEDHLRRGLRAKRRDFRAGEGARASLAAWLSEHDLREAVELVGKKPLFIAHARGDERIPYTWSEELYARASEPRKLVIVAGGHHRSVQHDPELQGESLRWIERRLG